MERRRLRVLQIVSSSATSGAEHHALVLSRLLARRGHHVEVVCPPIPWMVESLERSGIPHAALDLKAGMGLPAQRLTLGIARRGRFDVVHTHLSRATYLGASINLFLRIPLVTTVHVETREPIYRFLGRRSNRVVAVSNYIHGVLKGRGVRADAIDVVYNGTEFADVPQDAGHNVHQEFAIPERRKLVGLIGRVAPEKGHHIALEALPRVLERNPESQLVFVGRTEGDFHLRLRERAAQIGVAEHVTFTGNRADVPRLLDSMAFSILPSVMESFGLAVIECMARGRPVVASRVGGLTELVAHGETGLLVDQTSDAFASAMSHLLSDPDLCQAMGRNARIVIQEKFTVGQMVERLEAVYARAIQR